MDYDVAILGAGVAGLAAARILARSGKRVVVVEARDRIGGRIFTQQVRADRGTRTIPVELGAEFIHGLPQETWELIREAKLQAYELHGAHLCSSGGLLQVHDEQREGGIAVLENMTRWVAAQPSGLDMSFAQYLSGTAISASARARAVEYVEGFNAADSRIIGIAALAEQQQAEDAIDGDRLFHVERGYDAVPSFLARETESSGGTMLLGTVARRLVWQRGAVTVSGVQNGGRPLTLTANRALISVPLGVLQAGAIEFVPAPGAVLAHARRLRMGPVVRITLVFRSRFWSGNRLPKAPVGLETRLEGLSFLFTHRAFPSTWWTAMPDTAPMITGWIAGPNVAVIEELRKASGNADALLGQWLNTLANAFGLPVAQLQKLLLSWHTHDWQADPYAQGAYSYPPAGAIDASAKMTQPVDDTLYFAGEHTDTSGHWGTVHAAVRSGIRAATQLLQAG